MWILQCELPYRDVFEVFSSTLEFDTLYETATLDKELVGFGLGLGFGDNYLHR